MKPFSKSGAFEAKAEGRHVRHLAVRGIAATLLSGGMGLAIQIVATMVLARLLTPKDFGLVAMVTTFSLLLMNFGLNGFTEAIVQRDELDHTLASNIFWINVVASLVLAVGFALAGSLLAKLYHDPRVAGVAEALALTIVFTGLSVVHLALLKRAMLFPIVSAIDIAGRAASVIVSILLARAGWGYWALVAGFVAIPACTCICSWISCRWVPSLPRRAEGTGAMLKFAANTYARFSTGYFANNLDNFLVGWRLGATPLGFYKKAFDLFVLPSNQLSTNLTIVAVSALSRLQKDLVQYKRYLLSALGVMALVGMGLGADLTLVGKDLILVLLGPKWGEAGRLFTIFGPGIAAMLLYCSHIWIHLSIGRADRWFRWGLVDLAVTTVFLIVGLHWGAAGIAAAWVAAYWTIALPAFWYAGQPIQLEVSKVVGAVWKYLAASLVAGLAVEAAREVLPIWVAKPGALGALARVFEVSIAYTALYLGAVIALHGGLAPLRQFGRLLGEMISRRKPAEPSASSEPTPNQPESTGPEFSPAASLSRQCVDEQA